MKEYFFTSAGRAKLVKWLEIFTWVFAVVISVIVLAAKFLF